MHIDSSSKGIEIDEPEQAGGAYADLDGFCSALGSHKVEELTNFQAAKWIKEWEDTMSEDITALFKNKMWGLVLLPREVRLVKYVVLQGDKEVR